MTSRLGPIEWRWFPGRCVAPDLLRVWPIRPLRSGSCSLLPDRLIVSTIWLRQLIPIGRRHRYIDAETLSCGDCDRDKGGVPVRGPGGDGRQGQGEHGEGCDPVSAPAADLRLGPWSDLSGSGRFFDFRRVSATRPSPCVGLWSRFVSVGRSETFMSTTRLPLDHRPLARRCFIIPGQRTANRSCRCPGRTSRGDAGWVDKRHLSPPSLST